MALDRMKQGTVDFKPIGSETLHTQHGRASIPAGTKIVTDAGLEVPPGVESTAPERMYLNAFQALAEAALALGLEPEPVDIAAIPALRVPRITVLALEIGRAHV